MKKLLYAVPLSLMMCSAPDSTYAKPSDLFDTLTCEPKDLGVVEDTLKFPRLAVDRVKYYEAWHRGYSSDGLAKRRVQSRLISLNKKYSKERYNFIRQMEFSSWGVKKNIYNYPDLSDHISDANNVINVPQGTYYFASIHNLGERLLFTGNLQDCHMLFVKGNNTAGELAVSLAHVDRVADIEESLDAIFSHFGEVSSVVVYSPAPLDYGLGVVRNDPFVSLLLLQELSRRGFSDRISTNFSARFSNLGYNPVDEQRYVIPHYLLSGVVTEDRANANSILLSANPEKVPLELHEE